jgi:LPXTG-motif cell wall-anchored protein
VPKNEGGDVVNNATIIWLGIMAVIGIVMIVMKKRSNAKDEG